MNKGNSTYQRKEFSHTQLPFWRQGRSLGSRASEFEPSSEHIVLSRKINVGKCCGERLESGGLKAFDLERLTISATEAEESSKFERLKVLALSLVLPASLLGSSSSSGPTGFFGPTESSSLFNSSSPSDPSSPLIPLIPMIPLFSPASKWPHHRTA